MASHLSKSPSLRWRPNLTSTNGYRLAANQSTAKKETGSRFFRIVTKYQVLYLVVDPSVAKHGCEQLQEIVESVQKLDEFTFRLDHDTAVTGS